MVFISLVYLIGVGLIVTGGIIAGIAWDSIFISETSKYGSNNEEERKKIIRNIKKGLLLGIIGFIILGFATLISR